MTVETLITNLGDFAKDIRLNLINLLTEAGATDLTTQQIALVALSSAYAGKQSEVIKIFSQNLSAEEIKAAKTAAVLMAMNNVYYRFTHSVSDKTFANLPAKLRMNGMHNPGLPKIEFEMMALAVSAIHGCGLCTDSHTIALKNAGVSMAAIQSVIRLSAVLTALSLANVIN